MKRLLLLTVLIVIYQNGIAQKEVLPIAMSEDSKFQISASAKSLTDVTLTIKVLENSLDETTKEALGFKDKEDEKKIDVKPFYESTFKQKLKGFLTNVALYEQRLKWFKKIQQGSFDWDELQDRNKLNIILDNAIKDKLKGVLAPSSYAENITDTTKVITDENKKLIIGWASKKLENIKINGFFNELYTQELINYLGKNTGTTLNSENPEYYKAKVLVDESLDRLFQYFNNQIILLFKYDVEPVAGTLHYSMDSIKVQYFPKENYEILSANKTKKHHRLIRRLYRLRRERLRNKKVKDFKSDLRRSYKAIRYKDTLQKIERLLSNNVLKKISDVIEKMEAPYDLVSFESQIENIKGQYFDTDKFNPTKAIPLSEFNRIIYMSFLDFDSNDSLRNVAKNIQIKYGSLFAKNEDKAKEYVDSYLIGKLNLGEDSIIVLDNGRKFDLRGIEFKFDRDLFKKEQKENLVKSYFGDDSKISDSSYANNPSLYLQRHSLLINYFRNFNRSKRLNLIYENIIEKENQQIFDSLANLYERHNSLIVQIDKLDKVDDFIEDYRNYEKLKRQFEENKKTYNNYFYSRLIYVCENISDSSKRNEFVDHNGLGNSFEESINRLIANNKDDLWYYDFDPNRPCEWLEMVSDEFDLINAFDTRRMRIDFEELHSIVQENQRRLKKTASELREKMKILNLANSNYFSYDDYDFEINNIDDLAKDNSDSKNISQEKLEVLKSNICIEMKKFPLWYYDAESIELDINDGFIEHITMLGTITGVHSKSIKNNETKKLLEKLKMFSCFNEFIGKSLVFKNQFPYGFSSSKDFDDFKEYELAAYNGKHRQFDLKLEDIFPNYIQKLQNDRLDFSPRDQVVTLPIPGKEDGGSVELKKETSSKLFNLSLYTDFLGLRGDPNGIVQFEFNKPIPIYTKRKTSDFGERYLGRGFNYGYFNYINPQLRWSRLDVTDDDRNLRLSYVDSFEGGMETSVPFVTTLDLLRYENVSVGADLNFLSLDFPTAKWRMEANISARYGRTRVLDTQGREITSDSISNIVDRTEVNTWRYYPELIFRLRPEERYGANLMLRAIRFNTVTTDFSTVSSAESFRENLMDNQQWLHQIEINAHFSPSARKDDKVFFRYRYSNNANWETNGYSEIQVGYNMSLKF